MTKALTQNQDQAHSIKTKPTTLKNHIRTQTSVPCYEQIVKLDKPLF